MSAAVMPTTKVYLRQVAENIERGPLTMQEVARAAGIHPTVVSRWRSDLYQIEPRLSAVERLNEAHEKLLARWRKAHPEEARMLDLKRL